MQVFYSFVILVHISKTKEMYTNQIGWKQTKNADSCFREFFFLHVSYMSTMIYLGKKTSKIAYTNKPIWQFFTKYLALNN